MGLANVCCIAHHQSELPKSFQFCDFCRLSTKESELRAITRLCVSKRCEDLEEESWTECVVTCQSAAAALQAANPGSDEEEEEASHEEKDGESQTVSPFPRQVDPLQSCIETKCFYATRETYAKCVFNECIMKLGLGSRFPSRSGRGAKVVRNPSLLDKIVQLNNSKNNFKKRGVNDITDVCIDYYCPREVPGTLGYLTCVSNNRCRGWLERITWMVCSPMPRDSAPLKLQMLSPFAIFWNFGILFFVG